MASLFDEGDFAFKKGSGYLERHKDYYEKNKETIKERRRNYYYVKKEALTKKVGRFEFAKISAIKNLAEIPDPFEPYGRVKIENLNDSSALIAPKNNIVKPFKRRKANHAGTQKGIGNGTFGYLGLFKDLKESFDTSFLIEKKEEFTF